MNNIAQDSPPPVSIDAPPATGRSSLARLVGIDIARFVAIVGMLMVHILDPLSSGPIVRWAIGNASTLFALLAGVSVVLSVRRYLAQGQVGAARLAVATRGLALIAIGLVLGLSPSGIVVVLVYLGASLCGASLLLTLRSGILATLAAVLALAVPPLNLWARTTLGVTQETGSASISEAVGDPLAFARGLLLTGTYPVLTWIVYIVIGMLIARALTAAMAAGRDRRFAWTLTLGGATTAALTIVAAEFVYRLWARSQLPSGLESQLPPGVSIDDIFRGAQFGGPSSFSQLFLDTPHSGSLLDIVRGIGFAAAVIGACLLIFGNQSRTPFPVRPIAAAGAAPLSSYVLHVLLHTALTLAALPLAAAGATEAPWWLFGWGGVAVQLAAVLVLGTLLAALRRRGPLETLMSGAATATARLATSKS